VADIDLRKRGEAVLKNHRVLQPNGPGFYEASGFAPDGALLYAWTPAGQRFSDDVWRIAREGAVPVNLTASPGSWDEHGVYSPDARWFGFVSSRFDPGLRYPAADTSVLATELFLQRVLPPANASGAASPQRATAFNALQVTGGATTRRVVSRLTWRPDSRQLLMQVSQADRAAPSQLWLLDVPR
jgi:hypothetical protein